MVASKAVKKVLQEDHGILVLHPSANALIKEFVTKQSVRYALEFVLGNGDELAATDGMKLIIFNIDGADLGKDQLYRLTKEGYLLPVEKVGNFPKYNDIIPGKDKLKNQEVPKTHTYLFSGVMNAISSSGFFVNSMMFKMLQSFCLKDIDNIEILVGKDDANDWPCIIRGKLYNSKITIAMMPLTK